MLETLDVVFVSITILILVMLPNIAQHFGMIDKKGCEAHVAMVQTQVEAYRIDHMDYPTVDNLVEKKYISESHKLCPDKKTAIKIEEGQVKVNQ